ncbi:hypothetical protein BHE74_00031668 [Ensete ventricosum]|nr:hypothetical protein GW17_00012650 [Ensete ventricosum]RWW61281.1 hypothetical protein BHE74_00031668 [Ensete ventricosum]
MKGDRWFTGSNKEAGKTAELEGTKATVLVESWLKCGCGEKGMRCGDSRGQSKSREEAGGMGYRWQMRVTTIAVEVGSGSVGCK